MFSGIVAGIGTIKLIELINGCKHFTISVSAKGFFSDVIIVGESIAVNGVCLTLTAFNSDSFKVEAVPETLKRTNLDKLLIGHFVNLERSLRLQDRIGGHCVQGHIDGIGEILEIVKDQQSDALLAKISIPAHLSKYLVTKGYIALDGMSITLIMCEHTWFTVTFISYTKKHTLVQQYKKGHLINLEVDILGKYVEKILRGHPHVNIQ